MVAVEEGLLGRRLEPDLVGGVLGEQVEAGDVQLELLGLTGSLGVELRRYSPEGTFFISESTTSCTAVLVVDTPFGSVMTTV